MDHLKKGVPARPEPAAHGVMMGPYPGLLDQKALKNGAHVYILSVGRGYKVNEPAHPGKIRALATDIVGPQLPWHEHFKIPPGPSIKNMGPFHDAHVKQTHIYVRPDPQLRVPPMRVFLEYSSSERRLRILYPNFILVDKLIDLVWDERFDGPSMASSSNL